MTDRREPSLRAAARAEFFSLAEAEDDPHPGGCAADPPPGRGRDEAEPSLTDRAQALYEAGVVPVREIARLTGVAERTIYKYARKGGWTQRYKRDVRGAGGRFVPADEVGKPHAAGLKALDPEGGRRASERCVAAGALSEQAVAVAHRRVARAKARRATNARVRVYDSLARSLVDLIAALPQEESQTTARALDLGGRLGHAIITAMGQAVAWRSTANDRAPGQKSSQNE
jgi:hypothetical protein